ncbi:MAG: histone deacetylase [Acidimicrobiales bacterium]
MSGPGPLDGGDDDLVWYAAYGSNLWQARFLTYLTGGPVPLAPSGRHQRGARDATPPRSASTITVPHRLFFARASAGWGGGGVAMLDPEPDPREATRCRLWLVSIQQFADVFAQENGHPDPIGIDVDELRRHRHADLHPGWYGRALHLGQGPGGHPVLTLTCPAAEREPLRAAHPSYLAVVGLGLVEGWGLDEAAAARYLAERDGNRGSVDPSVLHHQLVAARATPAATPAAAPAAPDRPGDR